MAIIDVKNQPGFVYDDELVEEINDRMVANAYFDESRARELGMLQKEIAEKQAEENIMQVIVRKVH